MAAMFKKEKDLTERSRALLKNKETKKLKAEVRRFSGKVEPEHKSHKYRIRFSREQASM